MNEQTTFDLSAGEQRKKRGMERAAAKEPSLLYTAQGYAEALARKNGTVTVDDVIAALQKTDWCRVGNWAGSIFRGKQWVCVGRKKSTRASNHAREIKVWGLKC